MKNDTRKLERIVKGFANHSRINILLLLKIEPELSVDDISGQLKLNYVNASDHIRKLAIAGLVMKRYEGTTVRHKLTPRGSAVTRFCSSLD